MALFKIFRGPEEQLSSIPLHEGYAYFTEDKGNLYIDISEEEGGRVQVNAYAAEVLRSKDGDIIEIDDIASLVNFSRVDVVIKEVTNSITIPDKFKDSDPDKLAIYHNGVLLVKGVHYNINNTSVELLDYSTEVDDIITFAGSIITDNSNTAVTSFNGRDGKVEPQTGDYTAEMVGAISKPEEAKNGQLLTFNGSEWKAKDAPSGESENSLLFTSISGGQTPSGYMMVTYGDGTYMALNPTTKGIAISTDAINWDEKYIDINPGYNGWGNLVYLDNKFILVGLQGILAYSSDKGQTWKESDFSDLTGYTTTFESIIYHDGKFYMFTMTGDIYYTEDLVTWSTSNSLKDAGSTGINGMAYLNNKFITMNVSTKTIMYSSDAINWETTATIDNPPGAFMLATAYGNGIYVLSGRTPQKDVVIFSTDDCKTWKNGVLPTTQQHMWVVGLYGAGKFVLVSSEGNMVYSEDGENWTPVNKPEGTFYFTLYTDKFISVSPVNGEMIYSLDGVNWSKSIQSLGYPNGTDMTQKIAETLSPYIQTDEGIKISSQQITIPAEWEDNTIIVSCPGITADESKYLIVPTPTILSQEVYYNSGVRATNQGEGTLTFTCDIEPEDSLNVYVVIVPVETEG